MQNVKRKTFGMMAFIACLAAMSLSIAGCQSSGLSGNSSDNLAGRTGTGDPPQTSKQDPPANPGGETSPSKLPTSGLYAVWYNGNPKVLQLPYVKGGQIALQWADLQTGPDTYNWGPLDQALKQAADEKRIATLQVNGNNKPEFLFRTVPNTANWGDVQVKDKQGVLMYWHPLFVKAYTDFVKAMAAHLYESPYRAQLLGIRQNFNAVGTEHTAVPAAKRKLAAWTFPEGEGDKQAVDWSQKAEEDYKQTVLETFVSAFSEGHADPIPVFVRNNLGEQTAQQFEQAFDTGRLAWFHTSSEIEPRGSGVAKQYEVFLKYALPGKTLGYAEPWASAWGDHGGKRDERWISPPQWNYWRLLSDLNMGVSFIAAYGNDLEVALNGKYMGASLGNDYQSEFTQAFQFAAKYAGHQADPAHSPGAWIAFRQSVTDLSPSSYNREVTDYAMHIKLLNPQDTIPLDARKDGAPVPGDGKRTQAGEKSIGPYSQRYGAWARKLPPGHSMRLELADAFARSLGDNKVSVRVTYLDDRSGGSFTIGFGGDTRTVELQGSGDWKTAEFDAAGSAFSSAGGSPIVTLTDGPAHDIRFHMVEVTRQ